MARAYQRAEWDRAAEIIWRLHNAWYEDPISAKEANPLRNEPSADVTSIKHHFKPKAKPT